MSVYPNLFGTRNSVLVRRIFSTLFRQHVSLNLSKLTHSRKLSWSSNVLQSTVNCYRSVRTSAITGIHQNPRNQRIKANAVLLIDRNGEKLGTMALTEALRRAKEDSLQLVQIQNQKGPSPAICKLVSSRTLYESEKKAKHTAHGSKTKELKITGRIAPQDLQWKSKKIHDFLEHGYIVKLSITRKPYQKISNAEKMEIIAQVKEEVKDVGMIDGEPKEIGALALRCNFKPIVQKDKTKTP